MRLPAKALHVAIVLSLGSLALPAAATQLEIEGGRSYMDGYAASSVFVESVFPERRIGSSRFSWSPDVSFGWIDGRDVARYRNNPYSTADNVWLAAVGVRFHYGDAGDWYRPLFFSIQPALQRGRTQALSSGYEFASTLGWQWQHFSVQIRHVSNAGLHEPNRGETMALIGVGFEL